MQKLDELRFCIIIPVYNHARFLENTLKNLEKFNFFIYVVDDGSKPNEKLLIKEVVSKYQNIELISFYLNQGKGAVVLEALKKAYEFGFTHAIQVDADGQHNFENIFDFINKSKEFPHALISGLPIYDASIPKARLYGRYITHFWVWVETLSFKIKDSMCGFRSYPLHETNLLITQHDICRRMDFDTDIMVRLYFQNVDVHFIETKVIYPKNGFSNFHSLKDNIRISIMHTRLCLYMIFHFIKILKINSNKVK